MKSEKMEPAWLLDAREEAKNVLGSVQAQEQKGTYEFVLPESLKAKGVVLVSIEEALCNHPDLVKKFILEKPLLTSRFSAENQALFHEGFFLHIPDGVFTEEVIEIRAEIDNAIEKSILSIGKNSHVNLMLKETGKGRRNGSLDVSLGKYSFLNLIVMHSTGDCENLQTRSFVLEENSSLSFSGALVGSQKTESLTHIFLNGRKANLKWSEIVFGTGTQNHLLNTRVVHANSDTHSKIKIKSVLKDNAKCFSDAMVKILKEGSQSTSHLSNHALLLNTGAIAEAIPGLEIEARDVRAGHSASVSPVNKEHLFYLMSRGISEEEAKKIIVLGFLEDAIDDSKARELFWGKLEEQWTLQS